MNIYGMLNAALWFKLWNWVQQIRISQFAFNVKTYET